MNKSIYDRPSNVPDPRGSPKPIIAATDEHPAIYNVDGQLTATPPAWELPERHTLSYYKVLGLVKALLIIEGEDDPYVAEAQAVEKLKTCKPDRRAYHGATPK